MNIPNVESLISKNRSRFNFELLDKFREESQPTPEDMKTAIVALQGIVSQQKEIIELLLKEIERKQ